MKAKNIKKAIKNIDNNFIVHFSLDFWGGFICIMEKNGKAFGRVYWYDYDDTKVFLDMLSVTREARKQGLGTKLQEIREQVGRDLGATTARLWVRKRTWMHKWYKRRGYIGNKYYENDKHAVWMDKLL